MSGNLPATTGDEEPASAASVIQVRIGSRTVPAKTSPTCRTCQSRYRAKIEHMILSGYSRPKILEWLSDLDPGPGGEHPSEKSLRLHTKRHLPLAASAEAAILERRAEALGDEIEKYGGQVADHLTALDIVVAKGFAALQAGEIQVDATTLMKAIDLKHKIDASMDGGIDANVWRDALMEYMRIALDFIPHNLRAEFARAISTSPVLKALAKANQPDPT